MSKSVAPFYAGWRTMNARIADAVSSLSAAELAWSGAAQMWPVWAVVGHLAGARVYWLCHVLNEPGVETTPFTDPQVGWEDDPARPRGADELVAALGSSWAIVEGCLDRWTPAMLAVEFPRERGGAIQLHSRQSILLRLLTHDASHAGEVSQILGAHGREAIDLWSHLSRVLPQTTSVPPRSGDGPPPRHE